MAKQLHQVDWSAGQVDGDNLPGMVKEILNMELDRPGAIYTRDSMFRTGDAPESAFGHAQITTNPTGDSDYDGYTWDIYFRSASIYIRGSIADGSGPTYQRSFIYPFEVADLDADRCETVTYGEKVFFCAVDTSNEPLGVCLVSCSTPHSRFRNAPGCADTDWEIDELSQEVGFSWSARSADSSKPSLYGRLVRSFMYIGHKYMTPGAYGVMRDGPELHDLMSAAVNTMRNNIPIAGCGLLVTAMPEEAGLYGPGAVVEFMVQFKYSDGGLSSLSEPFTADIGSIIGDTEGSMFDTSQELPYKAWQVDAADSYSYGIGCALYVGAGLPSDVDEVRVYKKVVSSDNSELTDSGDIELMHVAKVVDDDSEELVELGSGTATLEYRYGWMDEEIDSMPLDEFYGMQSRPSALFGVAMQRTSTILSAPVSISGGTIERGSGWIELPHMRHYVPECYGARDVTIRSKPEFGSEDVRNPSLTITGFSGMFSNRNGADSDVRFSLGMQMPVFAIGQDPSTVVEGMTQHTMRINDQIAAYSTYMYAVTSNGNMIANCEMCSTEMDPDNASASWNDADGVSRTSIRTLRGGSRYPTVFYMDYGRTELYTDESLTGVAEEDAVKVRPRHIAVSGGRLFCLNGYFDGIDEETRMFYSAHGNYSSFSKYSYVDYGAREDGVGVAISTFRNKLVLHFTGATYTLDISGGIDSSWRELGAVTGIGAVSIDSIVETPVGVFWYNGVDVIWFNGSQMEPVSHLERQKRSVRETIDEMVNGRHSEVRLVYRRSMRQVWLCIDNEALVLDIDSLAWHYHVLEEVSGSIISIKGEAGSETLFTDAGAYSFSDENDPAFQWGVKTIVDIGVPEIIKKAKRIYVDFRPDDDTVSHEAEAIITGGQVEQSQRILTEIGGGVSRLQASIRGRHVEVDVHTLEGGERWRGEIESVGMSYKPKRVK